MSSLANCSSQIFGICSCAGLYIKLALCSEPGLQDSPNADLPCFWYNAGGSVRYSMEREERYELPIFICICISFR